MTADATGLTGGTSTITIVASEKSSKTSVNEVQQIKLTVGTATGNFQIAVPYNGRTYTTASLALTASAADVQTAVNTALTPVSGSVSVTKTVSGTGVTSEVTYELTYSGTLAGKNLDNAVVSVLTDAPAAGGSFTLSYDGQTTAAITLSSTTSTQATSIQTALQALSNIGSNNVTVAYDSTSASTAPRFLVTFAGNLASKPVKALTASGTSLQNATVTPRVVTEGRTALGETQTVTLTKPTTAGTFTLKLTHNSVTYTTTELAFNATAAAVQTALTTALASLTGATATVNYFNSTELSITFAGTLAGVDLANLNGTVTGTVTAAGLSQSVKGFNRAEVPSVATTLVVDYKADPLTISGSTFKLDMDGADGEITKAKGTLSGTVASFANVDGTFSFQRTEKNNVPRLTVGATGVTAFVGNESDGTDAKGIELTSGKLGLVVLEKTASDQAKYALTASGTTGFKGLSDFTLSGSLDLQVQRFGAPINETITVGTDSVIVKFDDATELTRLSGTITLGTTVASLNGSFTVQATGSSPNQEILFSASSVSAFVGENKGTAVESDDVGFKFTSGSLIGYIAANGNYAFEASGTAALSGVTGLTLAGTLYAQKNTTGADVNKSITVGGTTKTLAVKSGVSSFGGSGVTLTTPVASLNGSFTVQTTGSSPNQEILFSASSVSAFVGENKGTAVESDDVGFKFTSGSLIGYIAANGNYAFEASGTAALSGVTGLTLAGTLYAQKNTTGADVNKSITVGGTTKTLAVKSGVSSFGGSGVTLTTPVASLNGSFTVQTTGSSPSQEILFVASSVSAFVGEDKGTELTTDDIGVRITGGSLVGYIAADGKYAFDASGTAALAGVTGLTLSGTLSAQKNTVGTDVDKSITVAGTTKKLLVGKDRSRVAGTLTVGTGIVDFTGSFAVEAQGIGTGKTVLLGASGLNAFIGDEKSEGDADNQGLQVSNIKAIVGLDSAGKYFVDASGDASVVGVTDLTVSGKFSFEKNTTSTSFDQVWTVGDISRTVKQAPNTDRRSGSLVLQVAQLASISGDFLVETDTGEVRLGATNVKVFLGSMGSNTTSESDDVGLKVTASKLGVVVFTGGSAGKIAASGSGTAAFVGLDGLTITSTLKFEVNTSGQAVDRSVKVSSTESTAVTFSSSTEVRKVSGTAAISADGVFSISGTLEAANTRAGEALIDMRNLNMKVYHPSSEAFELGGNARFIVNAADGFRLVDMGLSAVKLFKGTVTIDTAGTMPPTNKAEAGGSSSYGGNWGTGVDSTGAGVAMANIVGGSIDRELLNQRGYIDIDFRAPSGDAVDEATITDDDPEFTLSGTGVKDAVIEKVVKISNGRYRYFLKDSNTNNTTDLFDSGSIKLEFPVGSWETVTGIAAPAATLDATVRVGKAKAASDAKATADRISLTGPSVWIEEVRFYTKPTTDAVPHTAVALVTIGVGADKAALNLGSGTSQADSGVSIALSSVVSTFDIDVELNIDRLLNKPGHENEPRIRTGTSGRFDLSVGTLDIAISDVLKVNATGVQVKWNPNKDADYNGTVSDTEGATWDKQEILTINTATVKIVQLGIQGSLGTYTRTDGTLIDGLTLRNNGLTLGTASLTKTGDVDFGTVLTLTDPTAGVTNLDITYGQSTAFTGDVFIAASSASLLPETSFSATLTDGSDSNTEAVRATLQFNSGKADGFKFTADQAQFKFGTYLTAQTTGLVINTAAKATDEMVSFASLGVTISIGSLSFGGEMRNFAFLGDGSFKTKTDFGVIVSIGGADPKSLQWPAWLPIQIQELGVTWTNITEDPDDFNLILSAGVTGMYDLPLTVTGSISRVVIKPQLLADGKFPITDIEGIAVSVTGDMFGGKLTGSLMGGILKLDASGNRIPVASTTEGGRSCPLHGHRRWLRNAGTERPHNSTGHL
jgi:hypothetical protein